jgi:hypothetical protein
MIQNHGTVFTRSPSRPRSRRARTRRRRHRPTGTTHQRHPDGCTIRPVSAARQLQAQLRRLALGLADGAGDRHPSSVLRRSSSTSNSAKVASVLKNNLADRVFGTIDGPAERHSTGCVQWISPDDTDQDAAVSCDRRRVTGTVLTLTSRTRAGSLEARSKMGPRTHRRRRFRQPESTTVNRSSTGVTHRFGGRVPAD